MKSVKLYGYATSPFVVKTACYLYYKGIDFTHVPVNPIDPDPVIGFTGQTQVPILEIDGAWRLESSQHAWWLDEVFPEKPLCPPEHDEKIRRLDHWVDYSFILGLYFRMVHDFDVDDLPEDYCRFARRAGVLVSSQTPLSDEDLDNWHLYSIKPHERLAFVKHMGRHLDLSESTADMQARVFGELVTHLGGGPYVGELDVPTMLDFSLFPNLVNYYLAGIQDDLSAAQHPAVKAWLKRVAAHLPVNPTLYNDEMLVHSLEEGLA